MRTARRFRPARVKRRCSNPAPQVGFYDFVALPLVHAMTTAFPGAKPLMKCFLKNYNHWRVESGQSPVEVPPSKELCRSGSVQPAGPNQGLASFLLSVPDDMVDVPAPEVSV